MMSNFNLNDLSAEQKAALMAELEQEQKAQEIKKEAERKLYKEFSAKSVDDVFDSIMKISTALSIMKGDVFSTFMTFVNIKTELYNVKDTQQSHTWSNAAGDKRISIGYRVYDRWDDTVNLGVAKVKEYLETLARDSDASKIMRVVNNLLKKDDKGNLKPSRVLELIALKKEIDDPLFIDGVGIIEQAHYQEKSRYFIEAEWQDDDQKWNSVPLAVSSVDFPSEVKKKLFPEETIEAEYNEVV